MNTFPRSRVRRHHRRVVAIFLSVLLLTTVAQAVRAESLPIEVYKSPSCGCCQKWVEHLQRAGYRVEVTNVPDVQPIKRKLGVPAGASACHTAVIGGYFIEGHVPAQDVSRLLAEHPKNVAGLALPGMPIGSPGMEGPSASPYSVLAVQPDGKTTVFAEHRP
jgi:hypothetical protein